MNISNPRRTLLVGGPSSGSLLLLKGSTIHSDRLVLQLTFFPTELTGSAPEPVDGSTAGLSHFWTLKTSYYTAELSFWIDEISDISRWKEEFLKPEAAEVVAAVGAWIFCFRRPVTTTDISAITETLAAVQEVVQEHVGYEWDGVCIAVAMSQSKTPWLEKSFEEWEDLCREKGFEYVDSETKGRNEFGERVGVERVKEVMEANAWDSGGSDEIKGLEEELGFGGDDFGDWDEEAERKLEFGDTFAAEEAEMGREFVGLKMAVAAEEQDDDGDGVGGDSGEDEVEELERIMGKMMAIKGMCPFVCD